jgi:glycosyltransferase involved in cell wall biosynthesis
MNAPASRIAIVTNVDWYFWSHRLPVARAARDRGHEVIVIAAEERGLGGRIREEGFEFVPIRMERGSMRLSSEIAMLSELRGVYRRLRPKLVHHVAVKPVLYGGIAARLERVPAVINALAGQGHLSGARGVRGMMLRGIVGAAYRIAFSGRNTRAIFQNSEDLDYFTRRRVVSRARSVLIRGSGVDLDEFALQPEPAGVPVVLFASRLLRSKGIENLVHACARVRSAGVPCLLRIAGEPDVANPDAVPEELLRRWVGAGDAEYLGRRNDMPQLMAGANIVALPTSYGEGVPKVLIEAAAAGRAIVTTDSPGCRDIVRDGVNGKLVPRGDVAALAEAIAALIGDPSRRQAMGLAGRSLVEREFSVEIVVRQTMALYDELLAAAGNGRRA